MKITSRRGIAAAAVAMAAVLALVGCSSGTATGGSGGTGDWTAAEVQKASGNYKVAPLFAVPKTLPEKYSFVFLSPGLSNAFFATWSQGMKDAAKFYGVDFQDADLNFKYETELSAYQQLSVRQPQVVGGQTINEATYQAIKKDGAKLVMIDGTYKDALHYGVPDEQVGQLAIQQLVKPAQAKQAADWKGKQLLVAGLSAPNCGPCDDRVKASFAEAEKDLGIPASSTFLLTPPGQDPTSASQSTFADFLTAHPDAAVLVVSYGDEPVIGAVNAAKAANRQGDVLAITNGGDEAARDALRDPSNKDMLVGSIDYQPYAEGWNWIEAAIATAMGKEFGEYKVDRVLTPDNVDSFYPNDK
jgi:ABC-type sugar transport system substrate-binding protein